MSGPVLHAGGHLTTAENITSSEAALKGAPAAANAATTEAAASNDTFSSL